MKRLGINAKLALIAAAGLIVLAVWHPDETTGGKLLETRYARCVRSCVEIGRSPEEAAEACSGEKAYDWIGRMTGL